MATTLSRLLVGYVYAQLKDRDNKNRWTREELTKYVNLALRDIVARRPEAGVYVDTFFRTAPGALQVLPTDAIRLKELVENANFIVGDTDLTQTFSQQVDITAAGIQSLYGDVAVSQPAPSIAAAGTANALAGATVAVAQPAPAATIAATAAYPAWEDPTIVFIGNEVSGNGTSTFFVYWPFSVSQSGSLVRAQWDVYKDGILRPDNDLSGYAAVRTIGGATVHGVDLTHKRISASTLFRFVYTSGSGAGNPFREYASPTDYAASFDVTLTAAI